jgi:hypothetical protein
LLGTSVAEFSGMNLFSRVSRASGQPLFVRNLFFTLGWIGIIAAVITAGVSLFAIRPRLQSAVRQIDQDLQPVTQAAQSLQTPTSPPSRVIRLLPEMLGTLQETTQSASATLYGSAKTTNDAKKGIAGIVMPKTALGIDTARLNETGRQLGVLAGQLGELQSATKEWIGDSNNISVHAQRLVSQLNRMRSVIRSAAVPTSLIGLALSALYFMIGALSFVFAYAFEAVIKSIQKSSQGDGKPVIEVLKKSA